MKRRINNPKNAKCTLMWKRERLIKTIESLKQDSKLLLWAPAGSGKKTLALQWLEKDDWPFIWFGKTTDIFSSTSLHPTALQLDETGNSGCLHSFVQMADIDGLSDFIHSAARLDQRHNIVLELPQDSRAALDQVARCLQTLHTKSKHRWMILTECLYPIPSPYSAFYDFCFDYEAMKFSREEIESAVRLIVRENFTRGEISYIQSTTAGWPKLVAAVLASLSESRSVFVDIKPLVDDSVKKLLGSLPSRLLELLTLTNCLAPMPETLFSHQSPLHMFAGSVDDGIAQGYFTHIPPTPHKVAFLSPSTIGRLLQKYLMPTEKHIAVLSETTQWLLDKGYIEEGISALSRCAQWDEMTAAVERHGDAFVSTLESDVIYRWIQKLDHRHLITSPRILLYAIRCSLQAGSRQEAKHYYQYLLSIATDEKLIQCCQEKDRAGKPSFLSEFEFFCTLTPEGKSVLERLGKDYRRAPSRPDLWAILQQCMLSLSNGNISAGTAYAREGYRKTLGDHAQALHVIFSALYAWSQLSNAEKAHAEQIINDTRSWLIDRQITHQVSYGRMDVMDFLCARTGGQILAALEVGPKLLKLAQLEGDTDKYIIIGATLAELLILTGRYREAGVLLQPLTGLFNSDDVHALWLDNPSNLGNALKAVQGKFDIRKTIYEKRCYLQARDLQSNFQLQSEVFWAAKLCAYTGATAAAKHAFELLLDITADTGQQLRALQIGLYKCVLLLRDNSCSEAVALLEEVLTRIVASQVMGILYDPLLKWDGFLCDTLMFKHRDLLLGVQHDIDRTSHRPASRPAPVALSKRETAVLLLLSKGISNQGIAKQLNLSVTTVRTHLRNIYAKLCVSNRTSAVYEARKAGMI